MPGEHPEPVRVPESQVGRQATDALEGYVYQLHQTVLAWLTLAPNELLHIEIAEDIAISDDGELRLTQVKRTAANTTLRSEVVAKLITSVWEFQVANPARRVSAALLTTSSMGIERGMSFPGDSPGLVYWRVAAREKSDVEPIRTALLALDLSVDLKSFVETATADELRTRIICPIRWFTKGVSQDELDRDIDERLVLLGSRQGVPAEASKNARDSLVGALLECVRKPAHQRYLTSADLLTTFQRKTFVTVPPGILERLTLSAGSSVQIETASTTLDVARITLTPRIARRSAEVKRLHDILVSQGRLWLHGSSGLGKTTLAVLLARSQAVSWRFADLRDLAEPALRSVLFGIAVNFRESGARGLILDDLPAEPSNMLMFAIGQVAQAVADSDGVLIITSAKPPPPTFSGRLELGAITVVQVPYLAEADVGEIVSMGGGDPKKWARSILAFAGGHPQLVDARVAGLRRRGWNEKEILTDLMPRMGLPNDFEEERKAVRNRLLQDLEFSATELLLRLSLLLGNFDRPMALVVASTPAAIPQPGLLFDFLVGPWIEQVGPERYRLSPLLKDSGSAGLANSLCAAIKSDILRYLIIQRPFPADQLLQVFLVAFQKNDHAALRWFAGAVFSASMKPNESRFKRLAQELSIFTVVDRGESALLVRNSSELSAILRLTQLRVAVAIEDMDRAVRLVDKALSEISLVPKKDRTNLIALLSATVMLEPRLPLPPTRWLTMLLDFVALPAMQPILLQPLSSGGLLSGLPAAASPDEMMFVVRASALKNPEELAELVRALEERPKATRDRYIGAAARTNQTMHLIVTSSWLAEVKRPTFDARAAAATYHELRQGQTAKENPDLAVELVCAEAAMLADYADDVDGALELLRTAQEAYPNDYRLNRQRQKVFYRNKQHAQALAEFEKFCDRMPVERVVDRAYALREAGRSAAEIGELDKTRSFFEQAWEASSLSGSSMKPMTAGLLADCAILDFDGGRIESALNLMRRALLEADDLDPRAGLKESFVRRIHIAAILYMRGASVDFPAARQAMVVGMCSEPDPPEWFRTQPHPQPVFVWYELAELEAEVSHSHEVLAELRQRTKVRALLPKEITLVFRLAASAIRYLDVDSFLETLKDFSTSGGGGLVRNAGMEQ